MSEVNREEVSRMPANRDKQGRFIKGQSGNPNGRPGIPSQVRELAEKAPDRIEEMLNSPATPAKVRAQLLMWCYEVVYGKPRQSVDMEADVTQNTPLSVRFEGKLDEWSK